MTKKLTLENVISRFNKSYELIYIDYRDNLDENLQPIQDAIHSQDISKIDEYMFNDDWMFDAQYQSIDTIQDELKSDLLRDDFTEKQIDRFNEKYRQEIIDEILDRDNSDPINDLLRNTTDPVMFYELDLSLCEGYDQDNIDAVKGIFNIQDDTYNKQIEELLINSFYGGTLVIYFTDDIRKMINTNEFNTIEFKDPTIALIDLYNGSGSDTRLPGLTIRLPYDPKKVFIDKLIKYNYTYDVCGMYSDWCNSTQVKFLKIDNQETPKNETSPVQDHLEIEKKYNETFKSGKCTAGDMDMRRHRDTYYLNEFPCGTHCPHCHTFWID